MDTQQTHLIPDRSQWVVALTAHPAQTVIMLADTLAQGCTVEPRRIPQAGLTMLRLQESVYGEDFYLGELPFASAVIDLVLPDGRRYPGAAQVMADTPGLALALAVCDAVLAHQLEGYQAAAAVVAEGQRRRAATQQQRQAMLASTRVDFAPLESTEEVAK